MSEEGVEVVRRWHEAFDRGGPEAVLPLLDPEVEWHDIPDQPEATVHHGYTGFLHAMSVFLEPFAQFTVTSEELRDLGDHVLDVSRIRGRGLGSGAEFNEVGVALWTLRAGKVVQVRFFRDRAEALEVAGLQE